MYEFRRLSDDHPDLRYSPLIRAARLTLRYAVEEGPIGLTKTKAFKRSFVHWAAEHFEWPGSSSEELFRYNKVLNEYDFAPLELLHFLLTTLKMGRHYKGEFRASRKGEALSRSPGKLFHELIPFYILRLDHAAYGRLKQAPVGTWDVWLNVTNVELENGASERELYNTFYEDGRDGDDANWREIAAFSHYVLTPLEWSGLIATQDAKAAGQPAHMCFKTPLWRSALKLETDNVLKPATRH
ncbi:hypothetical protein [Roseovarius aestuarii]|uniref:Uncharacterized protein n=1 Tax=Roseovarius aestuarii TaxID=475083 RepID=A0A1X7BXX4_9RHOB|nr:hypothetical protein [Roseovarius aestuarii]SMC14375.1 hypothetical protein ROA7745_04242 [Roseovarius aestuarii]